MFKPIETDRASGHIVKQVKDAIRQGDLRVGDRLPSERELAQQLSVSRVTVRDALRVLEARGLIQIRVGAHGGAFVTAPVTNVVSEGLVDLLALSDLSATEVTETRRILEIGAVPLVCERRTADDIAALEQICQDAGTEVESGSYSIETSAAFHLRLVQATHNRAAAMMMGVLQDAIISSLREAHAPAETVTRRGVDEHKEIVEAIRNRDAERTQSILGAHLSRTLQRLNSAHPFE